MKRYVDEQVEALVEKQILDTKIEDRMRTELMRLVKKLIRCYPDHTDRLLVVLDGCWELAHSHRESHSR